MKSSELKQYLDEYELGEDTAGDLALLGKFEPDLVDKIIKEYSSLESQLKEVEALRIKEQVENLEFARIIDSLKYLLKEVKETFDKLLNNWSGFDIKGTIEELNDALKTK